MPELTVSVDYAFATCKHECAILKQSRHIRQAYALWSEGSVNQRALMLSRSGQCGVEIAKASLPVTQVVATMEGPEKYAHLDINDSTLYSASALHLHGLPFDYDALRT